MRQLRSVLGVLIFTVVLAPLAQAQTYYSDDPRFNSAMAGFGGSVAIGDNEVFVGEAANTYRSGVVYVYRKSGNRWAEAARITAPNARNTDGFGRSVAVSGSTMLVSQFGQAGANPQVHVYQRDRSGNWTHAGELTRSDAMDGDGFGFPVVLSGDWAMVGASQQSDTTGAVYVFHRSGGRWSQAAKLLPADAGPGDQFGLAIALDGGRALISSMMHNGRRGAVYAYRLDGMAWQESGKLSGTGVEENERFGSSVALQGGRAVIGSVRRDSFTGIAYTFQLDTTTGQWQEGLRLLPFDAQRNGQFSSGLAIDGNDVLVGAPGHTGFRGRVYAYHMSDDGTFQSVRKLADTAGTAGDFLGAVMAARNGVAVIAVVNDDGGAGSALIFERDRNGMWQQASRLVSPPEGLTAVTGGRTNCAEGQASLFDCQQVDMISFLPVSDIGGVRGTRLNDTWGWTDPDTGREYAIVGRTDGTSFIDITDPANPRYLGDLPRTAGTPPAVWRDMKVYANHTFIVADGSQNHGMQVFDLTQLRNVRNAPVTFTETAHYDRVASAHNIVINEATGFAYIVGANGGGDTCGGGLHMIDIRNPASPTFAGCFQDTQTGNAGTGYSHDAMCIVYNGPDEEHRGREICFGANENALSIGDVTDKSNPVALSRASYPNVGYAHQGWITEDHRYFYMNDELDELQGGTDMTRTMVWDVSDLDDPILALEFMGTTEASDHNLYIRGNLMYQSNYQAGLRVIDISDPVNPREVGYFDTVPVGQNQAGFGGSWSNYPYFRSGTIIVTSSGEGVFFLQNSPNLVP